MERIAAILKTRSGSITIRGHTDARPFRGGGYDNWRLSTDRAQMAYYMLVRGGLDEKRVVAIEGYADRRLKKPGDPEAAENRRIEILLREAADVRRALRSLCVALSLLPAAVRPWPATEGVADEPVQAGADAAGPAGPDRARRRWSRRARGAN